MEKTKQEKASKPGKEEKILEAFIDYKLSHGEDPPSIYQFAKTLKIDEQDFYQHFNSFSGIERAIWLNIFNETRAAIEAEEVYAGYSAREKLLSFYYTLIEVLKKRRSYVLLSFQKMKKGDLNPPLFKTMKAAFMEYINEVLLEGKETGEIPERPYISSRYDQAMWVQLLFVINFWVNDDSNGFESTDAAVEKAVNLGFDLLGRGPVDSFVDLAKFLYQNRKG